jgi:hypothetical protein
LPKAAWHVEAADRRATISAAAAEFGVPPNCILMQQVVSHGKHRWPLRRGEITGGLIDIRDLAQVMEHARPLPHPGHDQPQ